MTPLSPDMTLLDLLAAHPELEDVIRSFDEKAGTCLCCNALFDPLQEICRTYHLEETAFFSSLAAAIRPRPS